MTITYFALVASSARHVFFTSAQSGDLVASEIATGANQTARARLAAFRVLLGQVEVAVLASFTSRSFHKWLTMTPAGNETLGFISVRVAFGVVQRARHVAHAS